MEASELLKKVRKIEIKTRGLTRQIFSGEYQSAFKGRGMAFSEVREYIPGDDIRSIDWNVTARFNNPFVKVFEEERELTVMLLVDVSASTLFGTKGQLKKEWISEICALLSFSALSNNDKTGVIFFSDKIEKFIPPKKGRSHVLRIIREILTTERSSSGTDLNVALTFLSRAIKKRCTAFVLSDFISPLNFHDSLKIARGKHDVVCLRVVDPAEENFPDVGMVPLMDAESGKIIWADTHASEFRKKFHAKSIEQEKKLSELCSKCGVDLVHIRTHEGYVKPLIRLFESR
ncbi:MAG: DUF58 domain-containing protein [Bacteroidia bacterium]|nr:DUF58 domain-containing protein [Bacteroidia bacterium]